MCSSAPERVVEFKTPGSALHQEVIRLFQASLARPAPHPPWNLQSPTTSRNTKIWTSNRKPNHNIRACLAPQATTVGMGVTSLLPGVKIPKLVAGSVAEASGMRKGDVIVAVNDRPISSSRENVNRLVQYIKLAQPPPITSPCSSRSWPQVGAASSRGHGRAARRRRWAPSTA